MRFLSLIILAPLCMWGCKKGADNLSDDDTLHVAMPGPLPLSEEDDSVFTIPVDEGNLTAVIEQMIEEAESEENGWHSLDVQASGYEYQTDATWSFDSLFDLTYCQQRWSSEGAEGVSHHFFKQGNLYALFDEEGNDVESVRRYYHRELGGMSLRNTTETEADTSVLEKSVVIYSDRDLKSQLRELMATISEHREQINDGNPATLVVESPSEMDATVQERLNIEVDEGLLRKLLEGN